MVLMRTIVRLRRFSSEPTRAARSAMRRLVAQLAAQRFARRVELAPLAADAARPGIAPQRVDHRAAHAPFGERLELDAAVLVEAVRRVDQAEHAVLNEIADVDRVRHRRRHASRERFDERQAGDDSAVLTGGDGLGAHSNSPWMRPASSLPDASERLRIIATAIPTAEARVPARALDRYIAP